MDDARAAHGHRTRPLVGGLSLLLLVTVAAANSAGGFQPLLAELTGQTVTERQSLRTWSGRLVEAVRMAARRAPTPAAVRPARAWDTGTLGLADASPRSARDGAVAAALVRVELLDLPPPARV